MHHSETTNGKLVELQASIETLIDWAIADSEHALEHDAPDTWRDDRVRAQKLRKALRLVKECQR